MFVEVDGSAAGAVERAQICVIGSGPAGMTLAQSLAERGLDVVMIEAGGLDFSDESQAYFRGTVVGDPYFDLSEARLRMFGGTANHWGGWCRPLRPIDFRRRPNSDNPGWPIGVEDLEPYLPDACEIVEIPNDFAYSEYTPGIIKTKFQYSTVLFGIKFREYCETSKSLRVFLDSALTGLRAEDGIIRAAEIRSAGDRAWTIEADKFVLCMGGIENSRMLLWMNQQANGAIVRNADLLGRYWTEHPHAYLGEVLFEDTGPEFFREGKASFALTDEAQLELGVRGAGMLLQEEGYTGTKAMVADLLCVAPALGRRLMDLIGQKELICGARLRSHWEQEPIRDNRVALGTELDPFGIPQPVLHWRRTEKGYRTVVESAKFFAEQLAEHDRGRVRLKDWILDGGPVEPGSTTLAGWHHMGGTRMSDSPGDGIVDRNLKVHGVENLYVGGSSVFPTGGAVNPTLTIIQLCLRLADHLAAG